MEAHEQEQRARDVAESEVLRFSRILADQIAATPARADGNINGLDLWRAFNDAIRRYETGGIA